MPRAATLLTICLGLAACGTDGVVVDTVGDRVELVKVVDGDTIRVLTGGGREERVRLIGINAPEMSDRCGEKAREHLVGMLDGVQTVRLRRDPTQAERDRFDRLLAYVGAPDDVGAEQVRAGWAEARRYGRRYEREERYERLESAAPDRRC